MKQKNSFKHSNIAIPLLHSLRRFEAPICPETEVLEVVSASMLVKVLIKLKLLKIKKQHIVKSEDWELIYKTGLSDNYARVQNFFLRKYKQYKICRFHKKRIGNCACKYD